LIVRIWITSYSFSLDYELLALGFRLYVVSCWFGSYVVIRAITFYFSPWVSPGPL